MLHTGTRDAVAVTLADAPYVTDGDGSTLGVRVSVAAVRVGVPELVAVDVGESTRTPPTPATSAASRVNVRKGGGLLPLSASYVGVNSSMDVIDLVLSPSRSGT